MAGKVQRVCIELRAKGYTPREIGKMLGKEKQVYMVCKRLGLQTTEEEHDRIVKEVDRSSITNDPAEYVARYTDKVVYHHGYINCDLSAWVECAECHEVFKVSMTSIRHKKWQGCPRCKNEREKLKKKVEFKKLKPMPQGKQMEIQVLVCKECGTTFLSYNSRQGFCSTGCKHKNINRKKDNRIPKDKIIDKNITLTKLYKRDKGVCHICGGLCDYDAEISSNEYPSIDHIKAVSQGGDHSWDNIKLAHRGCNTRRYYDVQRYSPW